MCTGVQGLQAKCGLTVAGRGRERVVWQAFFVALYETRYEPLQAVLDPAATFSFALCNEPLRSLVRGDHRSFLVPRAFGLTAAGGNVRATHPWHSRK